MAYSALAIALVAPEGSARGTEAGLDSTRLLCGSLNYSRSRPALVVTAQHYNAAGLPPGGVRTGSSVQVEIRLRPVDQSLRCNPLRRTKASRSDGSRLAEQERMFIDVACSHWITADTCHIIPLSKEARTRQGH